MSCQSKLSGSCQIDCRSWRIERCKEMERDVEEGRGASRRLQVRRRVDVMMEDVKTVGVERWCWGRRGEGEVNDDWLKQLQWRRRVWNITTSLWFVCWSLKITAALNKSFASGLAGLEAPALQEHGGCHALRQDEKWQQRRDKRLEGVFSSRSTDAAAVVLGRLSSYDSHVKGGWREPERCSAQPHWNDTPNLVY